MFTSFKNSLKTAWAKVRTSKLFWGGIIVVIIILIFVFKGKSQPASAETAVVSKADVVDSVVLSGRTQSASAVDLGFADQGRVADVYVQEGDKVTAGELLAKLDTSDLDASLENAQAALAIAKAGTTTNTINLNDVTAEQDALVASAKSTLLSDGLQAIPTNLDVTTTEPAPVITGLYNGPEGDYTINFYSSASNSGVAFNVSGLENGFAYPVTPNTTVPLGSRGLFIQFGSSVGGYANTSWTVSIPNIRSANYATNYNAYQSALATHDQVIAAAQADLVESGSSTSIAEAQVEQAQATIDGINAQIEQREITAPFDGVVATVGLKPGQSTNDIGASSDSTDDNTTSSSESDTIRLISENDYEVVLDVPEINISQVSVGQPVSVTLDAYGNTVFPATVTEIDPAETILDGVPVYETKVAFVKDDPRIRSGMTATATIVAAEHDNVLAIPVAMIHTDPNGDSYVYVVGSDGKTSKQVITTGLRGSDSMIEVTSGLAEGDTVRLDPIN